MFDLLPCPFCGQPAGWELDGKTTTVFCASEDCPVEVKVEVPHATEAERLWNTRNGPTRKGIYP